MIIPVCCIHNFILQNYIASCVLLVYKLQRCVPKLRILLLTVVGWSEIEKFEKQNYALLEWL